MECHYAECHYAERRAAECHGAKNKVRLWPNYHLRFKTLFFYAIINLAENNNFKKHFLKTAFDAFRLICLVWANLLHQILI